LDQSIQKKNHKKNRAIDITSILISVDDGNRLIAHNRIKNIIKIFVAIVERDARFS